MARVIDGQLELSFEPEPDPEPDPEPKPPPCSKPCMWLEEWYGWPYCYIQNSFRVKCLGMA